MREERDKVERKLLMKFACQKLKTAKLKDVPAITPLKQRRKTSLAPVPHQSNRPFPFQANCSVHANVQSTTMFRDQLPSEPDLDRQTAQLFHACAPIGL